MNNKLILAAALTAGCASQPQFSEVVHHGVDTEDRALQDLCSEAAAMTSEIIEASYAAKLMPERLETIVNTTFKNAITETEVEIAEMATKLAITAYNSTRITPNSLKGMVFSSCLANFA